MKCKRIKQEGTRRKGNVSPRGCEKILPWTSSVRWGTVWGHKPTLPHRKEKFGVLLSTEASQCMSTELFSPGLCIIGMHLE